MTIIFKVRMFGYCSGYKLTAYSNGGVRGGDDVQRGCALETIACSGKGILFWNPVRDK